jgi:hypothetical protein
MGLFLGAMQGRAAVLVARSGVEPAAGVTGSYMPYPILIAWLGIVVWCFIAWPWYVCIAAILGFSLLSGPLVSLRLLPFWLFTRVGCALVLVGFAVLLWSQYRTAG